MSITLTERAAQEVERCREAMGAEQGQYLRIAIAAGGCNGFSYKLDFDAANEERDNRYECHGVTFLVDKKSELLLTGTTIDFIEQIDQRGFKIENPNVVRSCGCGSSFQV